MEIVSSNICPATILANKRNERLAKRTKYEINSINIKKGERTKGTLDGKKLAKKRKPCKYNPTKRILNQTDTR